LLRLQHTPDHQKVFSSHAYIVHKKILSSFSVCSPVHISFLSVEPGIDSTAFRHDAHRFFLFPTNRAALICAARFLSFFLSDGALLIDYP
jgi:hypothetical protein